MNEPDLDLFEERHRAPRRDRLHDVRPGDRWLVIVAHPDDESFGCGSVVAHLANLGAQVTIACATRGEAGEPTDFLGPGADLGAVREAELYRAAEVLGVARVELLGFRDSGFDGEPAAGSLCAAAPEVVTVIIKGLLRDVDPGAVLILDGSDGHRDHLCIRAATREAIARCVDRTIDLYEHCLPNALMRRWLDEMRSTRPDTAYHSIDPAVLGRSDHEITDTLDVAHLLDVREAAIAVHRSQTSPFEGLSPDLRRAFLTCDHLAKVV